MPTKARLRLDGGDAINKGLLAFLPLTDPAGIQPLDISPYRLRSFNSNGTPGRSGFFGKATTFDTNIFVNVGGSGPLTTTNNLGLTGRTGLMALAGWVRFDAATRAGAFFHLGGATTGFALGCGGTHFDNVGSQIIGLYHNVRWITTGVNFATGWHHLAISLNASGHPTVYYDGRQIYSDATGAPAAIASTDWTTIGTSQLGARFFTGAINGFRAWGRSLTPTEVSRLYRDPWAGTKRLVLRGVSTVSGAYTLTLGNVSRQYGAGALGLEADRNLTLGSVARGYNAGAAGLTVGRSLALGNVARAYGVGDITLTRTRPMELGSVARAYGAGDLTMTYDGQGNVGGGKRTRRGARRIYLPEPEEVPIILPPSMGGPVVVLDDDEEEEWFLLS